MNWKRISQVLGLIAAGIGMCGFAGWVFGIDGLKRIHPAWVTMKANTALCLMLAGAAVALLRDEEAPAGLPRLILRYSPQRKILADGKDSVTIQAFVESDLATIPADLHVNLFASAGTLVPRPMLVTRTSGEGKATLTATEPGDVSVEFVGAQPLASVDGDAKLNIQFRVPVSAFRLEAKPAAISLVDSADLLVTLVDSAGRSLASDEKRTVTLALESTGGEIEKETIEIPVGSSEGRTRFRPTGLGNVVVSGSIDTLVNQTAQIKVSLPIGLLATSIVGGLIGGLLAWLRTRHARWTRIAIGSITGFMLYWAFLFGLVPLFPRANVLNPLTDFALSVLGGWLGTEVFTLILQKLGLVREPEAAKAKEAA